MSARMTFRRVTRHKWGTDPNRVVLVTMVRNDDGTETAQTWGAKGGLVEELESRHPATLLRQNPATVSFDGGSWSIVSPGCSCNVPGALRGFNPTR